MSSKSNASPDAALIAALGQVDLFADLTKKDLAAVAAMCRPESFDEGDAIVLQGDTSGRFYVLLEGTARVSVHGEPISDIGPGGSFGEIAVIDRGPRSASVHALSSVRASSLAAITLRPLLKEHPELSYKLLLKVCEQLRRAEGTLVT
jgi:CRP-like cAMP-binding protein